MLNLQQYSIFCLSSYGPTFGCGHDLHISDNSNLNSDSSNSGHSYPNSYGYMEGKNIFQTVEILLRFKI